MKRRLNESLPVVSWTYLVQYNDMDVQWGGSFRYFMGDILDGTNSGGGISENKTATERA
jgi:hypothetical protein